jgi:uncharacterized alpha-E superfamily protein
VIRHADGVILKPLLEIADSAMTYRRRYFAQPRARPVLDLLLADETNSRALAFQLAALTRHVRHLPHDPAAPSPTREQRIVASMSRTLREVEAALQAGSEETERVLLDLVASIEGDLRTLSDAVSYFYFSHAELRVS